MFSVLILLVVIEAVVPYHHDEQHQIEAQNYRKPCRTAKLKDRVGRELPFSIVSDALMLAKMSQIAYVDHECSNLPALRNRLSSTHILIKCIYNRKTDTEGFVALGKKDGSVVVAFGGSESIRDWFKTNILGGLVSRNINGRWCILRLGAACAHGGFVKAMNSVYYGIIQVLDPYIKKGRKVYITGHSLGGALGTLFTYKLSINYRNYRHNFNMFVYGTPPVGNWIFNSRFKQLGIRSYDIAIIGDKVSYKRCPLPVFLNLRRFHRPSTVYYLPEKGGHSNYQYISQLRGIQSFRSYQKKYQLAATSEALIDELEYYDQVMTSNEDDFEEEEALVD